MALEDFSPPKEFFSDTPGIEDIFKLVLKCNIKTFNQPSATSPSLASHSLLASCTLTQQAVSANDIHNCSFSLLLIMCSCSLEMPAEF